jgi:hypothetical protein
LCIVSTPETIEAAEAEGVVALEGAAGEAEVGEALEDGVDRTYGAGGRSRDPPSGR